MLKKLMVSAALLLAVPAYAQNVQQSGSVTRNHIPVWNTSGVIADGGSSADSPITSMGVTNNGGSVSVSQLRASVSSRSPATLFWRLGCRSCHDQSAEFRH